MSNSSINTEEIKNRCDIVDVIGEVIPLKKAGANYKGACPFHNEKTPSLVVSSEKQIFTCFGCGATGDVIEFTKKYYSLEFMEAIEKLAQKCGITITKSSGGKPRNKENLLNINREAAIFFFKSFFNSRNPGYKYMIDRGISVDTLKKFGIGYADENWTSLYDHLKSKGVSDKDMLKLGLVSEKNGRYFDKFRGRVIFPIQDTSNRIIGFGGRIIGDGMPKYLNSAESEVFHKKNNLYALNLAKKEIEAENRIILAEGYMDVIALFDKGIRNVSASLGTALTENQAKLLKRYTNSVYIAYDADQAGQNAAMRGIEIIKEAGIKGRVIKIPDCKDPDEYIKKYGSTKFLELLDGASAYGDYRLNILAESYNLEAIEDRIDFLKEAAKILRSLSPVERDIYIKKLSRDVGISEGAIRGEIGNDIPESNNYYAQERTREVDREDKVTVKEKRITKIEIELIRFMLLDKKFYYGIREYQGIFQSQEGQEIMESIEIIYEDGKAPDIKILIDTVEESSQRLIRYVLDNINYEGKEEEAFEECIGKIKLDKLKSRAKELETIITMLDEEEDREEIEKASLELMNIQQRIRS